MHVTGSAVIPGGEILLCNNSNYKIKVIDSSDVLKDGLKFESGPCDISDVDAKTAILTFRDSKQLQYIDVFPRLTLDKPCWCVHVTGD